MLRYSWKLRFRLSYQLMLLLAILLTSKVMANETLIFGHEEIIFSKVLNEERILLINLPAGYDASTNRHYPVLYTLDGNTHFKRVVGTVEWLSQSARLIEPPHYCRNNQYQPLSGFVDISSQGQSAKPQRWWCR